MIRESVEKLRGIVFTPEELQDVIKPAVIASEGANKFVKVGNPDDEEHSPFLDKCGEQYVPN